jgi:hypothetical protein
MCLNKYKYLFLPGYNHNSEMHLYKYLAFQSEELKDLKTIKNTRLKNYFKLIFTYPW